MTSGAVTEPRIRLTTSVISRDFVAADEGGANIERVRAFLDLLARPSRRSRPSRRVPETRGSAWSRWRCSARRSRDRRSPGAAAPGRRARRPTEPNGRCADRRAGAASVPSRRSMASSAAIWSGVGAAAAADEIDAVLDDEALQPLCQFARAERIMRRGRRRARAGRHWAAPRSGPASSPTAIAHARPSPAGRWRN